MRRVALSSLHSIKSRILPNPSLTIYRTLARTSDASPTSTTPSDKARTFLVSLGHDNAVAKGVVDALTASGLSGEILLSTLRTMAGRVEVGEDAGLEALVEAVKQDQARSHGKHIVQFRCVPPGGDVKRAFRVECYEGMSLTDVAKHGSLEGSSTLSEYMECACSGIMACSTCHVTVDEKWFPKVGPPSEDEQDMIDLAYQPAVTSRLGCQLILTPDLNGLLLRLPAGTNNMMDHIPFQD